MDSRNSFITEEIQDSYLTELLSYSLERLNKEPDLLKADADRVRRQMQEVAISNYKAFIIAAEAVRSIRTEVASIDSHLEHLIAEVPHLSHGCNTFSEEASLILEKRALNRTMLSNHPTLLDLLEIPQLMDTCVRNGNYDEALDLDAFVSKLATMHAKLPIIQSLVGEVRHITKSMLLQLLQRLRSNIQLPECLRVIAFLRRLAVFSETEMRLQFLRCREAFLSSLLSDLNPSNPYDYLKRITDCHRVQLFDVITQYRAIFVDDTSSQEETNDGGLLYSWAMHRITAYLAELEAYLDKIEDGGSLASVLEHCMYCGMSLGRVGLDFRGLLPPLFESCIQNIFSANLEVSVATFQHVLDSHRWVSMPAMGLSSSRSTSELGKTDDVEPPYSLMEHPPLAAFVNGVLGALNHLRHCAPTALRQTLTAQLQSSLSSVSHSIVRYHDTRIVRTADMALFLTLCRAFIEVACPYLVACFSRCYPGVGSSIDVRSVTDPVRKLLLNNVTAPEVSAVETQVQNGAVDGDNVPALESESSANSLQEGGKENGHGGEGGEHDLSNSVSSVSASVQSTVDS